MTDTNKTHYDLLMIEGEGHLILVAEIIWLLWLEVNLCAVLIDQGQKDRSTVHPEPPLFLLRRQSKDMCQCWWLLARHLNPTSVIVSLNTLSQFFGVGFLSAFLHDLRAPLASVC